MMRDNILADIIHGTLTEHVVSHGRSQYSGPGGVSACGLAAMNCARLVLSKERTGLSGIRLVEELMKEEIIDVSA